MSKHVLPFVGLAAAISLAASLAAAGPASWQYLNSFGAPDLAPGIPGSSAATNRIIIDSRGIIYITTGTNDSNPKCVWRATAPTTDFSTPTYTLVTSDLSTELANGWQGLAVDADDNLFVSGDNLGSPIKSQVRKFDKDSNPITSFGTSGVVINTTQRLSGCALMSDGRVVVLQILGARMLVLNSATGATDTQVDWTVGGYTRDITIKKDAATGNDVLYVNRNGILQRVTGGSTTNPANYQTTEPWCLGASPAPTDCSFDVKNGCFFFTKDNSVITGNNRGGNVYVVDAATGNALQVLTGIYSAGDVAAFTSGENDYLYVLTGTQYVQVYSKSAVSAAGDWSMYH
ncbi:MAG: hypothetical protein WCK47_05465 [bacterium]